MSIKSNKMKMIYDSLGPNEKTIIDKVKNRFLRDLLIRFVAIKLRLQFKGWLQYLLPLPLTLLLFLLAGIIYLLGAVKIAGILALIPSLLLLIMLFDIVTSKFGLRFAESRPKTNSDKSIFDLMRMRRSCRSYQNHDLSSSDMKYVMNSVQKNSEHKNLGVTPIRFEFISAPITVWPVVNARQFIVAIAPAEYDRVAIIDIGRNLQKVVIDATKIGLGTCWIGPGADHDSVMKHLGDRYNPRKDSIICLCAVGYKSSYTPLFIRFFNSKAHSRLPLSSLFFTDHEMSNPLSPDIGIFKQFGRCFESCQWAPSSYNGQTTRCVAVALNSEEGQTVDDKLYRFDFYAITSSRYYAAVAIGIWCANWEMGCDALGIPGEFSIPHNNQERVTGTPKQEALQKCDVSWIMAST